MKKLGTVAIIGAAVAAILGGAAGTAAADSQVALQPVAEIAPGEPNPNGTGSSATTLTDLLQKLLAGSSKAPATPVAEIAPGEPNPSGTGSTDKLAEVIKSLVSGSASKPADPKPAA